MTPKVYSTKPNLVVAIQFTGDNKADMLEFLPYDSYEYTGNSYYLKEEREWVKGGDYVVRGTHGELCVFSEADFFKRYDPQPDMVAILVGPSSYEIKGTGLVLD